MDIATITEPAFLITELRYTLGQLHVQLGDLDVDLRRRECNGRSIDQIVDEMMADERRYQERYRRLLRMEQPEAQTEDALVGEDEFEEERERTVGLLSQAPEDWPAELVELVREQVAGDRRRTTEIADCRKALYDVDLRPDLNQPLASEEENRPHALT